MPGHDFTAGRRWTCRQVTLLDLKNPTIGFTLGLKNGMMPIPSFDAMGKAWICTVAITD
jgi:hypothetical protein